MNWFKKLWMWVIVKLFWVEETKQVVKFEPKTVVAIVHLMNDVEHKITRKDKVITDDWYYPAKDLIESEIQKKQFIEVDNGDLIPVHRIKLIRYEK